MACVRRTEAEFVLTKDEQDRLFGRKGFAGVRMGPLFEHVGKLSITVLTITSLAHRSRVAAGDTFPY
jgi:hypothetical protein